MGIKPSMLYPFGYCVITMKINRGQMMIMGKNDKGQNIKKKLRIFIRNKFLLGDGSKTLDDDDSFMEKGIIDSTGILELVNFIEKKFHIVLDDEELIPDNLDSINKLEKFIMRKEET